MEKNENTAKTLAPMNLAQKLFQIQQSLKTFAPTEESGKIDPATNKPSYTYTPGWKIVEKVREQMDNYHLMLLPDYTIKDTITIDYPVYMRINGMDKTFQKKDTLVAVEGRYTWLDVDSGEMMGPFNAPAANMNGIDKSALTAISFSERTFLLKFFHITTREMTDEADAFNPDYIPGYSNAQQGYQFPAPSAPVQAYPQQPQPQMPQAGAYPAPAPMQPPVQPQPQAAHYQNPDPAGFDENNPQVAGAITQLMHFQKGTPTHQRVLNQIIGTLSANGLNCTDPQFLDKLVETAQARREFRQPGYTQ